MSSTIPAGPDPVELSVSSRERRYRVRIAPRAAESLGAQLDEAAVPARRFLVSNATVWRHHGALFDGVSAADPILVPDGERFKSVRTTGRVYDALVRARADRASAIVAVGGGVIGDLAGFAAATYLRGITLVQVPTTLLAQVDSSIGGKVGVNHPLGKNLIGAFHSPALVVIDPRLLRTLPRREFRAGLYEVIKYGVIASRPLFDRIGETRQALFDREETALMPVVAESCTIKAGIVEQDEHEGGLRRVLNFGHTIGHALEAVTKYRRFRHGEAVAYGMLVAAALAVARGVLPSEDRDALAALVAAMGPLPAVTDLSIAQVLEAAGRDKKVVAGTLHFVLPVAIGRTSVVTDVTSGELADALAAFGLQP